MSVSARMKPQSVAGGLVKLSWPHAWFVLKSNKLLLCSMVPLVLLIGTLPVWKSLFESALFNKADEIIHNIGNISSLSDILSQPITMPSSREDSVIEHVSKAIISSLPFRLTATVATILAGYLVIALFAALFEYLFSRAQSIISKKMFTRLRDAAFQRALLMDPCQLPRVPDGPGQYANAIQQGAVNISGTFSYVLQAVRFLVALSAAILVLARYAWSFALGVLLIMVLRAGISLIQARRLRKERESIDMERNQLLGRTDEFLSKKEIIMAFEQDETYRTKISDFARRVGELMRSLDTREALFDNLSQFTEDLGRVALILVALGFVWFHRHSEFFTTVGGVYFLVSMYSRMTSPMSELLNRYDDIKRSESTSKVFLGLLRTEFASQLLANNTSIPVSSAPTIQFDNVCFEYVEGKQVLKDCSFRVPSGGMTLIVGPSGSGKSTICRLLLKFWHPDQGNILVEQNNISELEAKLVREWISYTAQGNYIIDDSVRENLRWAYRKNHQPPTDLEMQDALKRVTLQTVDLNGNARELSAGQQQRLCLARLLLDESRIQIMDEPLTGIDTLTISNLAGELKTLFRSDRSTILLFSHRLSFAAFAKHVIVLTECGEIGEQGSPQELLSQQGSFARMYKCATDEMTFAASA